MLRPQKPGIPLPTPSLVSQPFWDGCRKGELRYQRCLDCQTITMNPAPACAGCFGENLGWEVSSGEGEVYSYTVVWRPQTPDFEVPYVPAIVELAEGFAVMSAIVGCEVEEVAVGMPVKAVFEPMSDEVSLVYFEPR